jgi:hypothetical protein
MQSTHTIRAVASLRKVVGHLIETRGHRSLPPSLPFPPHVLHPLFNGGPGTTPGKKIFKSQLLLGDLAYF